MKSLIKNLILGFVYYSGLAKARAFLLRKKAPLVRVLAWHHIYDPVRFEQEIVFLNQQFNIITPEDFAEHRFDQDRINILLTFDDGYASWHEHVLPLFQKLNLRGVFFVSSGFIDSNDNWAEFGKAKLRLTKPQPPLTWQQVRDLRQVGVIGGHSRSHADLAQLSDQDLAQDINQDKQILQQHSGDQLTFFAAPFGTPAHCGGREAAAAHTAGYQYFFTTDIDFYTNYANPLIPRTMIDHPHQSLTQIKQVIYGAWDIPRML